MIRYRCSLNFKLYWLVIDIFDYLSVTLKKLKLIGSGGNMVASLKLKGIVAFFVQMCQTIKELQCLRRKRAKNL